MNQIIASLASRPPFAWLRERDIDLLVCSELHASGELTRMLGRRLAPAGARFGGAWVSHDDTDGESDLVVVFSTGDSSVVALIENKIAAAFQPEQAERYAARARRWASEPGISRVVTVLLAPGEYMGRPGAEAFDERITYEEVAAVLRAEKDLRSTFLADALVAGIEAYRRGYVMIPDEDVSNMWTACWNVALEVAPKLRFQQPSPKPGLSTWLYFRKADGFSKDDLKRAEIVYKAGRGQVDLQFSGTAAGALARRAEGIPRLDDEGDSGQQVRQHPHLRAGDRLPWLREDAGGRDHRGLQGLRAAENAVRRTPRAITRASDAAAKR